jgi:hypothetical protein
MRLPRVTGNLLEHSAPHRAPGRLRYRALGRLVIALAVVALVVPTGCVRRRLAVRSNPPGAVVFVDNQQIGTTPCSVDFTYYGTREIRLEKSGYETLTVNQPIPTPWYQIPPLDFVSENVVPNKIQDHRTVAFDLQPQMIVPTEQLLDRANQLRQETQQGAVAPAIALPAGPPPGQPVTAPPNFVPYPEPTPALTPTPLPPVTQTTPPSTYAPPSYAPGPVTPYSTPTPAPFSAPTLEGAPPTYAPPAGTQQGPPLVSPPLR